MHPVFDSMMEFDNGTQFGDEEFCLHLNGGFNKARLLKAFRDMKHTTTVDNERDIFLNISNANCVVTNSYHGVYWGSLMGKKVVCIKTDIPKWNGLHENVLFAEIGGIREAMSKAKPVPFDYLRECRQENKAFHEKVMAALSA